MRAPFVVHIDMDSTYVRNGIMSWVPGRRNGWMTSAKRPVKNVDLWKQPAYEKHTVEWHWVKGHAGDEGNERADRLAAKGLEKAVASGVAS